jgi:D-alanine-D-alanine ligase
MRVLVVHGGSSSERETSLIAGKHVGDCLAAAGHEITYFDPGDDTTFMLLRNFVLDKDVVFPILHGRGGEDGVIQSVLESLGMAYVGSPPRATHDCFDKGITLQKIQSAGIVFPRSEIVSFASFKKHALTRRPFVLKPKVEGALKDTVVITNPKAVRLERFGPLFAQYGDMMLEEYIKGIELKVAVVGQQIWPAVEDIAEPEAQFTQLLCPPQHLDPTVQAQARDLAGRAHSVMGCSDMSETDLIFGEDGKLYFLEINTLPSLVPNGSFSQAVTASGLTLSKVLSELVEAVHDRKRPSSTV